jgi:hypothetical protein
LRVALERLSSVQWLYNFLGAWSRAEERQIARQGMADRSASDALETMIGFARRAEQAWAAEQPRYDRLERQAEPQDRVELGLPPAAQGSFVANDRLAALRQLIKLAAGAGSNDQLQRVAAMIGTSAK